MKTNIFNVREKKEEKIVIEEEKTKNPLLLFLKRHKNFIMLSILLFLGSVVLIGIGVAFSLFGQSTDFDISYLNGSTEEIKTNINPEIKDEDVSEKLLGAVGREEGVIILVRTFMDSNNDVIYYFSDKTSIIVKADGTIYRVSANKDGNYGINENGTIDSTAKQVQVKSTTTTLADGTIIINYSDGTAKVTHKNITIFVRNSNKVKINNGVAFKNVTPSGVSLATETNKVNNTILKKFTDNTNLLINPDGKRYIINPNSEVKVDGSNINYDKNNTFSTLEEKKLSDNTTVTYYENGSAIITDKSGNMIYVKKSGDIIISGNAVYEIVTNSYGYSKKTINCSDGKTVTYFDNGAAIIKYPDGTKKYVENSDEIIFDGNKNISSNPTTVEQISTKKTKDGYDVINFNNGKSEVIKKDGSSFIIDTSKLIFDSSGNITSEEKKKDSTNDKDNTDKNKDNNKKNNTETSENDTVFEDPLEGMFVSEAEHKFNTEKSIEYTNYLIINNKNRKKKFSIVIEEVENYNKYNAKRLEPKYVKYQATVGNNYVSATRLDDRIWQDENNKTNYVIYEGNIAAKDTIEVAITLYVDYAELDNTKQDSSFIGTIKTYVIS